MFKLFMTFLFTAALVCAVAAQNILIGQPAANATVSAGASLIVQLEKPMALTGSEEVAVVIGAFRCTDGQCPGADEVLGDILYTGSYNPQIEEDNYYPYQNFTITLPQYLSGVVQLGVAHFFLLGAGSNAQLQLLDTTLNIQ